MFHLPSGVEFIPFDLPSFRLMGPGSELAHLWSLPELERGARGHGAARRRRTGKRRCHQGVKGVKTPSGPSKEGEKEFQSMQFPLE